MSSFLRTAIAHPALRPKSQPLQVLLAYLALAAGYWGLARLGLELAVLDNRVSPVWPAAGLAAAALLRWGWHLWPGVFLGASLINFPMTGWWDAGLITLGNTGSALAAVALLRYAGFHPRMRTTRDVLLFCILAGGTASMVAATVGASVTALSGSRAWAEVPIAWLTWWLGDCIGVLLVGPVVLLTAGMRGVPHAADRRELAAAFALLLAVTLTVFWVTTDRAQAPLSFLLWPVLAWSALRLGRVATAWAVLLALALAITGYARGVGVLGGFRELNAHWVILQGFVITTAVPALVLATAIDQLRATQRHLALTQHSVDTAADGVVWLDADGRILRCNAAFADLMRSRPDALVGRDFNATCLRLDPAEWADFAADLGRTGRAVRRCTLLGFGDAARSVELGASALHHQGADYRCLFVRDLSEREAFEAGLYQTQKMELVGRLAGGIAHDFNNMLAALQGNAELLQMQLGRHGEDNRQIDNIVLACERARDLTHQLMVFSRKDRDRPQVIDLNQLVSETVSLNRRLIPATIAIRCTTDEEPQLLRADPSRINQLLMNLVINARDAMPGGGRILIGTETRDIAPSTRAGAEAVAPGRYRVLVVEDTGPGIDPAALPHVFEPFFTTKGSTQGTGLGLAIVHGIAHKAGGFVDVASDPGRGTQFTVGFPAAAGDPPAGAAGRLSTTGIERLGRGRQVLLVEDDERVLELVREVLLRAGFAVQVATNGRDGLAAVDAADRPYDLVVTDLVMPDLGGVDMASGIRERDGRIPVLFMSGYGEGEVGADRSRLPSRCAFIGKPFTIAEFAEALRELMRQDRVV